MESRDSMAKVPVRSPRRNSAYVRLQPSKRGYPLARPRSAAEILSAFQRDHVFPTNPLEAAKLWATLPGHNHLHRYVRRLDAMREVPGMKPANYLWLAGWHGSGSQRPAMGVA